MILIFTHKISEETQNLNTFLSWSESFFSDETNLNVFLDKKGLYNNYINAVGKQFTLSVGRFKKELIKQSEKHGYTFNPIRISGLRRVIRVNILSLDDRTFLHRELFFIETPQKPIKMAYTKLIIDIELQRYQNQLTALENDRSYNNNESARAQLRSFYKEKITEFKKMQA